MASDPPNSVPWHIANPNSWPVEEDKQRNLAVVQDRLAMAEAEDAEPSIVDYNFQQAVANDIDDAVRDAVGAGSAANPGPSDALTTEQKIYPRSKQLVKSGASFNTPWKIEEKPSLLLPDDEIKSSRMFELYKLQAVNFELKDGDTLVFIDFPLPSSRPSFTLDCYGTAYSSRQFRVHSEKLLATGSSIFKEMLSPTRQFRIQRRRKVVNKLPEGIKYVIDLTPPSEGEDLVFQLTELSLTPGIIKWWAADKIHGVDSCLVNGHDDVCSCMREKQGTSDLDHPPTSPTQPPAAEQSSNDLSKRRASKDPPSPSMLLALKEAGVKVTFAAPHYRDIPDYCPIRHCNSIIRLLMLIEGHHVIFDSAARVWTLLSIAKIFDCPLVLRDQVTQWLMYGVNTRFIEVLPEEALKIGFTLQLPEITQCAFRILVNELALELAITTASKKRKDPSITIFGRKKGDAGDELNNLIQHAAQALVDRVESQMNVFEQGEAPANLQVEEWRHLEELDDALARSDHDRAKSARDKIRKLKTVLNNDFKCALQRISHGSQDHHSAAYDSIDLDRAAYIAPEDFEYVSLIMSGLNKTQRRLCAFFYHDLMYLCEGLLSNASLSMLNNVSPGPRAGELVSDIRADLEALHSEEPEAIPINAKEVHPVGCERFTALHLFTYRHQLTQAVQPVSHWWHRHSIDPPLNLTRHLLLTLNNNEMKYLPLWAGGNDDGTGGVFESHVPSTDMGPNGPGPAYHTGITIPSEASSVSGSLMEEIRNMNVVGSTTAGSVDVHDSISTVYRPDKVITDDRSVMTESFTTSDGGIYAEARYIEPADHQATGKAIEMLVDSATENESVAGSTASQKKVQDLTADDWEIDDGSDSGSDTLSDSDMVML